jgi:uncharacterized protein
MKGQCSGGCCTSGGFKSFVPWIKNIHSVPRKDGFLIDNINYYKKHINPQLKKELGVKKICSFTPSCSQYAKKAIQSKGAVMGFFMSAFRIIRCNPITGGGYDPVK